MYCKPTSPQLSQSPQICFLTLETTGHSLSCGPGQRWIRTQIKKGREGRGRIVWCESLLSLLRNVELWKWLIRLFDIWSMCFYRSSPPLSPPPQHQVHFSSLALLLSLCVSVGVGVLDQEGDTRPSALGRLSHTASLKRGGSLRTQRPSSEYRSRITVYPHTN